MATFGSLGKIIRKNAGGIKRLAPRVAGLVPGAGPLLSVGLKAAGAVSTARSVTRAISGPVSGPARHTGTGPGFDFGDIADLARRIAPGGARGRGRVSPDPQTGRCPVGYHPAKDGNGCVRNRRTNVGNARALARALRRAEGFEKLARRTVNALRSGPKKFKSRAKRR